MSKTYIFLKLKTIKLFGRDILNGIFKQKCVFEQQC